jgi:chemotaxis protein MotA
MLRIIVAPIGFVAAIIIGAMVWPEFLNLPSLALTLGGSVTVTYFSYSRKQLFDLMQAIRSLFIEKQQNSQDHLEELARLTRLYRLEGLRGLENQERSLTDPFVRQTVGMLVDLYKEDRIHARLQHQLADVLRRNEISRQILLTLGRLLPSFGLIGTLVGMVLLLKNISAQDAQSLPSALGLAVLTTLYGAVLANVFVAPLAARLHAAAVEKEARMRLTIDWVIWIVRGDAATTIASKLAVFLPAADVGTRPEKNWTPLVLTVQR